jgi:HD superfamily phosphohydrolase
MQYLDPLYGQLEMTDKDVKLFQTEALTRLRDISLSVVPPLATPSGIIASRFEHSVGVAHLARRLSLRPEFQEQAVNLYLASLFHDAGSPPFSHASEYFLEELTGKDHEEYVVTVVEQSDATKVIKDYGGNPGIIVRLITGKLKPWSDLVNGTIDLDNIDNSLRWGLGWGIFQNKFYEPEELIQAYRLHDGNLALDVAYQPQIQQWELCRRLVYDVVYSDMNLAPGSMLFRALELAFAHGELAEEFFILTESQALYVLEHRCNPQTRQLIHDMRHWLFYQLVASVVQEDTVTETMKTFCLDWRERQKIADIVAKALGVPQAAVGVYAGSNKGFKKIHLPFVGGEKPQEHQPLQKLSWRIKVYLHPQYQDKAAAAQAVVESLLAQE